jgi:hypothetical protein
MAQLQARSYLLNHNGKRCYLGFLTAAGEMCEIQSGQRPP